jgi:hypothetical protein
MISLERSNIHYSSKTSATLACTVATPCYLLLQISSSDLIKQTHQTSPPLPDPHLIYLTALCWLQYLIMIIAIRRLQDWLAHLEGPGARGTHG